MKQFCFVIFGVVAPDTSLLAEFRFFVSQSLTFNTERYTLNTTKKPWAPR
mgnify:CR=1 FL=1